MNLVELIRKAQSWTARELSAGRLTVSSVAATVVAPLLPRIIVIPRSVARVFADGSTEEIRDVLPGYQPANPLMDPFRSLEYRFYVDIATNQGGNFMARRRLTAVVVNPDGSLAPNKQVEWSRVSGSAELRFLDAGGNAQTQLSGGNAITTNANGMAEVVITHPARSAAAGQEVLTIRATCEGFNADIEIRITRNDAVTQVDQIARRSQTTADHIWVYQPDANHRTALNQGIKELQEIANEVVSRHRGVNNYHFIPLDGIYSNQLRDALRQYLTTFTNIQPGADYPYDLRNINQLEALRNYIHDEYAPFDPNAAANRGCIVDRRLLIGDAWDLDPARIDGLWELERAVVERLKTQMTALAGVYLARGTFWLHRPIHRPYQAGIQPAGHPNAGQPRHVFRVTSNNVSVKTAANAGSPDLQNAAGNAVTVTAGELFLSPAAAGASWSQIQHPAGVGWVRTNQGRRVRDDQRHDVNHGIHGAVVGGIDYNNGVAYSYGCKDLPDRYTGRLAANPHALPTDGAGNLRRIAHWNEYADGHKVGRRRADGPAWPQSNQGSNRIGYHTGCDCSGFAQNCITQAVLSNNTRIVPEAFMQQITFNRSDFPLHAIASGSFVGNAAYARRIPAPANDAQRQWVRLGDLIAGGGHIVWVAENFPNNNARILNNGNTFEVYNEYGGDRYRPANSNNYAPVDNTRFLRKAIRMPYHYWRGTRGFNGVRIGKVFIWR